MNKPSVLIVTPALAVANNGNWQTAQRWARMLSSHYRVRLAGQWQPGCGEPEDLLVALHARRSAASVSAWAAQPQRRALVVVLTGTDLYRDIASDPAAQHSLAVADRLVVLNELGLQALPAHWRRKGVVCLQSTPTRQTLVKTPRHLRALMVGHLREEKSPQTYFNAAMLLQDQGDILLDHIGGGLDPDLTQQAQALMRQQPRYRWLGALPHAATRARIQAAHVLVHASRMEGGAHVVIEAVTSGTPVLASRIDGNVGLLGPDYQGFFDWGDAKTLAGLLLQCRRDPAMLPALQAQCLARAALFHPDHERQTLLNTLHSLQHPAAP
jgi:putative glycosyltransferase (TIGR04348 family)